MPVVTKNKWAYKRLRGERYTDFRADLKRHSQAHDGTAPMTKGAWRKFVGACVGSAIDEFVAEHGYTPAQEDLSIAIEFTTFEILVRVRDIENRKCV